MPGQIVHFEIPADDTARGREFWGSLFGWQFEAFPGPSEYHMTRIGDSAGAAITNMQPGKQGARAYFDVDDINTGAARVKELGGEADEPMPVPSMGWFVTCKDTQGNESASGRTTPPPRPRPGNPRGAAGGFLERSPPVARSARSTLRRRVGPEDRARGRHLVVDEPQGPERTVVAEDALAAAERDGVEHEPKLVDE